MHGGEQREGAAGHERAAETAPASGGGSKKAYEKPQIKTMTVEDLLRAVKKGASFPLRGFAG